MSEYNHVRDSNQDEVAKKIDALIDKIIADKEASYQALVRSVFEIISNDGEMRKKILDKLDAPDAKLFSRIMINYEAIELNNY